MEQQGGHEGISSLLQMGFVQFVFFVALPRLLRTSGKEMLLAVRSSQNQEVSLTEQEKLSCSSEACSSKERLTLCSRPPWPRPLWSHGVISKLSYSRRLLEGAMQAWRTLHSHGRKVAFCDFLSAVFLIEQILQKVGWVSKLMYKHCVLSPSPPPSMEEVEVT